MNPRTQRLIATEAIRHAKEQSIPEDEWHLTYGHIFNTYMSKTKAEQATMRKLFRMANNIGLYQKEVVSA